MLAKQVVYSILVLMCVSTFALVKLWLGAGPLTPKEVKLREGRASNFLELGLETSKCPNPTWIEAMRDADTRQGRPVILNVGCNKGFDAIRYYVWWSSDPQAEVPNVNVWWKYLRKAYRNVQCGECFQCGGQVRRNESPSVKCRKRVHNYSMSVVLTHRQYFFPCNWLQSLQPVPKTLATFRPGAPPPLVLCVEPLLINVALIQYVAKALEFDTKFPSFQILGLAASDTGEGIVYFPEGKKPGAENAGIIGKGDEVQRSETICTPRGTKKLYIIEHVETLNVKSSLMTFIIADKPTKNAVNTTTVDQLVAKYKLEKIDVISIDTEGHDPAVLRGARETLRKGKARYIEVRD